MWTKDRDLAVIDPIIFRDTAWAGQTLTRGDATLTGTTLDVVGGIEVPFHLTAIEAGHIVNIGGCIIEVESVTSGNSLSVTALRPTIDSPPQQPRQLDAAPFTVLSFRPQLEWAHRQLLAMLGLRPAGTPGDGPDETAVVNTRDLARLESLAALHIIYAAAGAIEDSAGPNNQRAHFYRRRLSDERQRTAAHLDLNGDGRPDAVRKLNILQLTRA